MKIRDRDRAGLFVEGSHDNRLFRGLNHIRGQRIALGVELFPSSSRDLEKYTGFYGVLSQAFMISEDHILSLELRGDISTGRDRVHFDLADAVRGYESDVLEGPRMVSASLEYRFPIHRDGSWSLIGHYLLLKDIRGFAFFDVGAVSNLSFDDFISDFSSFDLDFRHSAGGGIQLDFYGMQKAVFGIRAGIAAITDGEDDRISAFLNFQFTF